MTSFLLALSSALSILWLMLVWAAVYLLRDVFLIAEKSKKRSLGSRELLAALPLLLAPMVVSAYSFLTAGALLSFEVYVICFSTMLLGALLLLRPVLSLIRLMGGVRAPKIILATYFITYLVANAVIMKQIPVNEVIVNSLLMAAQLVLGLVFIYLAAYSVRFRELTVEISGKKFSTHYELSAMLLLAGLLLPLNSVLRGAAVYEVVQYGGITDTYVLLRFLAQFLMSVAGMMAFIAMWNFKKVVADFCFRFGSMSALIKKEK